MLNGITALFLQTLQYISIYWQAVKESLKYASYVMYILD